MQPDTIIPDLSNPQSWNRYSYVTNRPVNFSDPTGHKSCGDGEEVDCSGKLNRPITTIANCSGAACRGGESNDPNSITILNVSDNGLSCPTNYPNCGFGPATCGTDGMVDCPGELFDGTDLNNVPQTKTINLLDGNVVSMIPIYDYSRIPPKIIGYRVVSYAYDTMHVNPANYYIPSDGVTWTSFLWSRIKPIVMPGMKNLATLGIVVSCPWCEPVLVIVATVDSLNSAITFDTHLRTHDVYFPEPDPIFQTPLDNLPEHGR